MAVISQIKATSDNVNYNIRDDYSTWGDRNYAQNSGPGVVVSHLASGNEYIAINIGTAANNIPSGSIVTVSFDLEMKVTTANPTLLVYNTNNKGPMQFTNTSKTFTAAANTTLKQKCEYTNTYIARGSAATLTDNYLEFYSTYNTGNVFSISNLKLELSNTKSTDWSPAPEDIARYIGDNTIELFG